MSAFLKVPVIKPILARIHPKFQKHHNWMLFSIFKFHK
jgi:hypothetical protein